MGFLTVGFPLTVGVRWVFLTVGFPLTVGVRCVRLSHAVYNRPVEYERLRDAVLELAEEAHRSKA
jgi:hypothetical protein